MTDLEKRKAFNEPKCGENRSLVFKSATEANGVTKIGTDRIDLKLSFSDGIKLTEFNPGLSVKRAGEQMMRLGSLLQALGLSMDDIPFVHDWENFVARFIKDTQPHRGRTVYAKLTLNDAFYVTAGSGRAFSSIPDLEYSDEDLMNLSGTPEPEDTKFRGELPQY